MARPYLTSVSRRLPIGALGALLTLSCDQQKASSDASASGPALALIDSVQFHESDSVFVGSPTGLAVDPIDGSYYIGDRQGEHVIRFGADGRVIQTYGRAGSGPGELRGTAAVAVSDRFVFGADVGNSRLNVYERSTGNFVKASRYTGFLSSLQADSAGIWMGVIDPARGTVAARFNSAGDLVRQAIAMPNVYKKYPRLQTLFSHLQLITFSDSVMLVLAGLPRILIADSAGVVADSISIPAVRRRAYPKDLDALVRTGRPAEWLKAIAPSLYGQRLTTGAIVVVHANITPIELGAGRRSVNLDVFISVVSPDRRTACADGVIPVSHDAPPMIGFAGDTLLVVEQRATLAGPKTTLKRYTIGTKSCTWLDVR